MEDRRVKEDWEQTRLIYAMIANKPVYGYKIQPSIPKKILPFPWDEEGAIPNQDKLNELRDEVWGQAQAQA